MSHPTTSTTSITDMTDSKIPQPSWSPPIKQSLFLQAMKNFGYVSPDAICSIIYGPEPAIFDDGQTLSSTHYHVDACLWKGDKFIDGATFLVPSKLPVVDLCYSVNLDDITGVHHVTLRKASLRTILPLTSLSKPGFSSHVVEFSKGEMTTVARVNCATTRTKRKARKTHSREHEWDSSITQPRPVRDIVRQVQFGTFGQDSEVDKVEPARDQVARLQPRHAGPTTSTSHDVISDKTNPAPIGLASSIDEPGPVGGQTANDHACRSAKSGSLLRKLFPNLIVATSRAPDDSIIGSGRVVGQLPADDQSSLSNFPESIIHVVPRNTMASTSTHANVSDAPQAQEPMETAVDVQTSDISNISRRSSIGSQSSGTPTSTVPTSPSSSTFSMLPFEKSTLADLPKVPIAPGKSTYGFEALALEKPKNKESEELDKGTLFRRLSWDLSLSYRQLIDWDEIQSPEMKDMSTITK